MTTLEEAITTAISYETRIRDIYREAVDATRDPKGQKVFQALADDEQRHIDYLEHKQSQWKTDGHITADALTTHRLISRYSGPDRRPRLHSLASEPPL